MTKVQVNLKEIQRITIYNRERLATTEFRKGLFETISYFILHFAKNGKMRFIHPIDRELWDDPEIDYTKWKLETEGFKVTHKYHTWVGQLIAAFTSHTEIFIIDWNVDINEDVHYLMD